jgi:hypothetical protein
MRNFLKYFFTNSDGGVCALINLGHIFSVYEIQFLTYDVIPFDYDLFNLLYLINLETCKFVFCLYSKLESMCIDECMLYYCLCIYSEYYLHYYLVFSITF